MRFYHMIALVIIFNNILLRPQIVLTYHLFLLNYILNMPKLIYLLMGISFFYCIIEIYKPAIALLKSALACYPIAVLIFIYQHLICWDLIFFYLDLLGFKLLHKVFVKGWSTYTGSRARPLGCSTWLDRIV